MFLDAGMLTAISKYQEANEPFVMATVVRVSGSAPREVGAKMLITESAFVGSIGGGKLENLVMTDAREILKSGTQNKEIKSYPLGLMADQCCGGLVEIYFESSEIKKQLVVFGAGHVGQAVASVLSGTSYQVTLVDSREEWTTAKQMPSGVRAVQADPIEYAANLNDENAYVVVMTHSHDLDLDLIKILSKKNFNYLGLIGSENKWNSFAKKLEASGVSPEDIQKVKCPIGIKNLGKRPQEVAISLAAELL